MYENSDDFKALLSQRYNFIEMDEDSVCFKACLRQTYNFIEKFLNDSKASENEKKIEMSTSERLLEESNNFIEIFSNYSEISKNEKRTEISTSQKLFTLIITSIYDWPKKYHKKLFYVNRIALLVMLKDIDDKETKKIIETVISYLVFEKECGLLKFK